MICKTANYSDGGEHFLADEMRTELLTFYMVFFAIFWYQWK
jgi:hypothetical protein